MADPAAAPDRNRRPERELGGVATEGSDLSPVKSTVKSTMSLADLTPLLLLCFFLADVNEGAELDMDNVFECSTLSGR